MTENDLKNLWIGDKVMLIKSKRVGNFEGIEKSGKVRVRIGSSFVVTNASNLEIYKEVIDPFQDLDLDVSEPLLKPKKKAEGTFSRELDLHIEKLNPALIKATNAEIVIFQLKTFKEFIDYAYEKKWSSVLVIHGKGKGVLRKEIHELAKADRRIRFMFEKNNGGATEMLLG